jgi:hypothetical protein
VVMDTRVQQVEVESSNVYQEKLDYPYRRVK